jgi:hypothetical protein
MKKKTNNEKRTYTQDGYFHTKDADAKVGFSDLKWSDAEWYWPFDEGKKVKREIDRYENIK